MKTGNVRETSLLILEDGRILAQNLTPRMAGLLRLLQPGNSELALRAATAAPQTKSAPSVPPAP